MAPTYMVREVRVLGDRVGVLVVDSYEILFLGVFLFTCCRIIGCIIYPQLYTASLSDTDRQYEASALQQYDYIGNVVMFVSLKMSQVCTRPI